VQAPLAPIADWEAGNVLNGTGRPPSVDGVDARHAALVWRLGIANQLRGQVVIGNSETEH
jgi:hypothetical protein